MTNIRGYLHVVLCIVYLLSTVYDAMYILPPWGSILYQRHSAVGGRYKYLTNINMILQCMYFLVAVVNDLLGTSCRDSKKQSDLQRFRDWLFTSLVFPLGAFVTFIFWSLYAYDRELILPSTVDAWFPVWLNHIMHTLPLAGVLLEQITVYHEHQRGYGRLLPIFSAYVMYLTWLMFVRLKAGFWVYPVFDAMDNVGRFLFLLILSIPALICYVIGERIHVSVWGFSGKDSRNGDKKGKKQ